MSLEWSNTTVAVINTLGWPVIQIGLAKLFTTMPQRWFLAPPEALDWEQYGLFYQKSFRVRSWKDKLPDGASWFAGGITKAKLYDRSAASLKSFAAESWRGELCHWAALAFAPLFLIWNPLWADIVMVSFGFLLNLPCIIAQRFNRARMRPS
jgi:glycosyl-4,4'-diaponeurosporenoate acyltransferase